MIFQLPNVIFHRILFASSEMKTTFGERLQAIREAKGLTLPELSKRSHLGLATLFRYQQLADPGAIAYDALVRLTGALEVDVRYLTGEDQVLAALEAPQVASRESLKRFLEKVVASPRLHRGLIRIQDDPAAPKSIQQWGDFWRLLQRFTGRSGPGQQVPTGAPDNEKRPMLRVVPSGVEGKKPSREGRTKLRMIASR